MSLRRLAATAAAAQGAAHAQRRPYRPTLLAAVAATCLLAACNPRVVSEYVRMPPLPVACEAACLTPCAGSLPRWEGDPDSPATWDNLGPLVAALRERIDTCDAARAACVRCLGRIDRVGATCGTEVPCDGGEP